MAIRIIIEIDLVIPKRLFVQVFGKNHRLLANDGLCQKKRCYNEQLSHMGSFLTSGKYIKESRIRYE
jgi:citrate lyase synthetase